ncbi:MAG: hypothetical protein UX89_C0003G0022 [Parcubacteria group bacterium GW2011_GWA2_47_16]|nr:MAG: hypothetical protein UX89_C0003G0022 [Parcubacteria group bacterium GW2011_GWA2_47_16]
MSDFKKPQKSSPPAGKPKDTSWDKVATWYDDLLESGEGTYQHDLILPNVARLLELKKGEKVLDLACGQGLFSREFVKAGAKVTGVDLSAKLIAIAKERSPRDIQFHVSSADKLDFLDDNSYDAVVCVSAIQNIKNAAGVMGEMFRVLAPGGRLLIVMNHPAFRVPKRSAWGYDEAKKIQYRRVDEYLSESSSEIAMHPGLARTNSSSEFVLGNANATTVSFHHPLQFYFKALRKAGFLVSRLEEWTSGKESQSGPRAGAENKARKEFPLFLALEARKA